MNMHAVLKAKLFFHETCAIKTEISIFAAFKRKSGIKPQRQGNEGKQKIYEEMQNILAAKKEIFSTKSGCIFKQKIARKKFREAEDDCSKTTAQKRWGDDRESQC